MSPSNDGEKSQSDVEASQQSDEGEIHSVICPSREGQHQSQTQRSNTHFQLFILEKEEAAGTETRQLAAEVKFVLN